MGAIHVKNSTTCQDGSVLPGDNRASLPGRSGPGLYYAKNGLSACRTMRRRWIIRRCADRSRSIEGTACWPGSPERVGGDRAGATNEPAARPAQRVPTPSGGVRRTAATSVAAAARADRAAAHRRARTARSRRARHRHAQPERRPARSFRRAARRTGRSRAPPGPACASSRPRLAAAASAIARGVDARACPAGERARQRA